MKKLKKCCRCSRCKRTAHEVSEKSQSIAGAASNWVSDAANTVSDVSNSVANRVSDHIPEVHVTTKKQKKLTVKRVIVGILLSLVGLGAAAVVAWWQQGA